MMERPLSASAERKNNLQHLLREEMEMHLKEGRTSVERNQERVKRIKQLKEELQKEEKTQKNSPEESQQSGQDCSPLDTWSQEEYSKLQERMRKMKEDHERVIQEELLKMESELQEEQAEGLPDEVMCLRRERQILVLQIEALRRENQQAEADLEAQYNLHQREMHSLREESLQVFRTFRQVLEEQKRLAEGRYRTLLLEAIQDAVYLSSQNQQLQDDNMQLLKALAELKAVSDKTKLHE
ncbi:trichohyalin [Pangasianodon hypophthalmus]|uniref:trichohyalin n=1 Tax=Pangasianodon hypophthalmus TaxID=310915 RepID=UPI002307D155|nr:trichohyalin [Pangasianodon hypophthalmus]